MDKVKLYYHKCEGGRVNNFGDYISKIIVESLIGEVEVVKRNCEGKLLATGSIIQMALRKNDIVWGSGIIYDKKIKCPDGVQVFATRGPLTAERLVGVDSPKNIYGDPVLLLPLVYKPSVEKKHEIGVLPHYIDKRTEWDNYFKIDITDNWKKIIKKTLSCKKIMSSSLHGVVLAEAYGIPAVWIKPHRKMVGGEFKFQDYFMGTGRKKQKASSFDYIRTLPRIKSLKKIRDRLLCNMPQ